MKRIHLFEFEDFTWFPDIIRKGITDYIQFLANSGNIYTRIIPLIKKGIEKSSTGRIIDICSGVGGGFQKINEQLKHENVQTQIILTDKYPNIPAFVHTQKMSNNVEFVESSVDATRIPSWLGGFRTQFVSFHHFRPEQAKRILADAANKNEPIGIFEYTERSLSNFLGCLMAPLFVMLLTPFIRPLSFKKLFFTYIIPAIPFFTMWDGIVSILRTYSVKEMKAMTESLARDGYEWEVGRVTARGPFNVLYLMGYPVLSNSGQRVAAA